MITLQSRREIELMREAGKVVAACHHALAERIRPGVTTLEIDAFVESFLLRHSMTPAQKGYKGYPYASCTSVNDEICHGFPGRYRLRDGDIVTVDMVALHKGLHADSAWSYAVGAIAPEAERLLSVTREALFHGIQEARSGNRLYQIGQAVEACASEAGFSVIRDFTGHGISRNVHETPPEILHFFAPQLPGQGLRLRPGMTFTVEPMIAAGGHETVMDANGWTARTTDGSLCAQYEHTLAITDDGPELLTVM